MGLLEDTVVKARGALDVTSKKASELYNLQKLKVQAASLNGQLAKAYEALGRTVYDAHVGDAKSDDVIEALVAELAEKNEEYHSLLERISEARGEQICPSCDARLQADALFCMKCGTPLAKAAMEAEEPPSVPPDVAPAEETAETVE